MIELKSCMGDPSHIRMGEATRVGLEPLALSIEVKPTLRNRKLVAIAMHQQARTVRPARSNMLMQVRTSYSMWLSPLPRDALHFGKQARRTHPISFGPRNCYTRAVRVESDPSTSECTS